MSNVARVASTAANTLTKPLNVEEVFETYVEYAGSGTSTVDQGIDLSGEGGMWWGRIRNITGAFDGRHEIHDTERGAGSYIRSDTTDGQVTGSYNFLSTFTSTGYTGWDGVSGYDVVSWTFRKAPKFFDVVTYSGNSTAGRTVSHNLGTTPGVIMIKALNSAQDWAVYHRSVGATKFLRLNTTAEAIASTSIFNDTEPTATEFTVGTNNKTNGNYNYVAYLFAHNDGDGGFGPTGNQDIIKCGTCSGETGSNRDIDLGFEPQFIITKAAGTTGDWRLLDTMRGWLANPKQDSTYLNDRLEPNTSDAESGDDTVYIKPNGFYVNGLPGSGDYIYIAIRRGPMAVPESATDVFAVDQQNASEPYLTSGFPVDFAFQKRKDNSSNWMTGTRLQGQRQMNLDLNSPENTESAHEWDYMDGFRSSGYASDWFGWMWRRAPGFFDCLSYTGNSTSGHLINHNLGVAPEMIWVKSRDLSQDWAVWHKDDPTGLIYINRSDGRTGNNWIGETTATTFEHLRTGGFSNFSGYDYLAMLFATLDGVSKVGSFTSDGTDMTIDCGFSSGARFVLLKKTNASDDWFVWDTERGIVTGNDSRLKLNSNVAAATGADNIDPDNSGFIINNNILGGSGNTFIFYAIA